MDNKYINIWDYKNDNYPFQVFIGARGCGKTYSALRGLANGEVDFNNGRKFIYMRRTQDELDLIVDSNQGEGANPFKPINNDFHTNYGFKAIVKGLMGCYHRTVGDDDKYEYIGQPRGYGVALSTIAKIRGLSFEDCDILVYDEFIKEKHVRKLKGESDAFFNAIETFNRNRELKGLKPIMTYLLANSNDIYNEIFVGLGVITDVERMINRGEEHLYYKDRGLAIHVLKDNPAYSVEKRKTALYKLTEGTQFSDMALSNKFSYNDFSDIKHMSLNGYTPVIGIGKGTLFKKKGERLFYYSYAPAKCPRFKSDNEVDRIYIRKTLTLNILTDVMAHNIIFESYELKNIFLDILNITD